MLQQAQPVLACRDMGASLEFYTRKLGFTLVMHAPDHPAYAVIRRDAVELHLQWHDPSEWGPGDRPMLRIVVSDLEGLFEECRGAGVFHAGTSLRETPWGTREFGIYDPDRNGLVFYMDL